MVLECYCNQRLWAQPPPERNRVEHYMRIVAHVPGCKRDLLPGVGHTFAQPRQKRHDDYTDRTFVRNPAAALSGYPNLTSGHKAVLLEQEQVCPPYTAASTQHTPQCRHDNGDR
jgi:hypothetical protein